MNWFKYNRGEVYGRAGVVPPRNYAHEVVGEGNVAKPKAPPYFSYCVFQVGMETGWNLQATGFNQTYATEDEAIKAQSWFGGFVRPMFGYHALDFGDYILVDHFGHGGVSILNKAMFEAMFMPVTDPQEAHEATMEYLMEHESKPSNELTTPQSDETLRELILQDEDPDDVPTPQAPAPHVDPSINAELRPSEE